MTESREFTKESDERLTPLMKAIGYVATGWARLEYEVNRAIWSLASMSDEDGACVTAQIPGILPRMRALIALAHRHGCNEKLLKELTKFSSTADGLARQRNRIVHDPWFEKGDDGEFGRLEITADKRLVFEIRPHDPVEILRVASDITDAVETFSKIRDRIAADLLDRLQAQLESHPRKRPAERRDRTDQDTESE